MTNGYKAMLRDRVPFIVDIALKYLEIKTIWINHVYDNFIKIYKDKDQRYEATRIALGISKKNREFNFHNTIMWENLSREEYDKWNRIKEWIEWFALHYSYIKNDYDIAIKSGKSITGLKIRIIQIYKIDEKLFKYLVKCFRKENNEPC